VIAPVAYPILLTCLRLVLGPVMVCLAWGLEDSPGLRAGLVAGLIVGLVSDIFDGIVARHLNVSTPRLRRFDSQTDLVFWLCVVGCVMLRHPAVFRAHAWQAAVLVGLEAACYGVSFLKFRRETCTHAYLAKLWGLLLLAAFVALLGWGWAGWLFDVMFVVGVIADLDVIAITLLLPSWQSDIPSSYHAWRIRRGLPIKRYKLFNSAPPPSEPPSEPPA
jgi:phosphatidylglycerophosphate synthase